MRFTRDSEELMRRALAGASLAANASSAKPASNSTPVAAPASVNGIVLGQAAVGGELTIDLAKLMAGRGLVQGVSGAGKSWTLRRVLEQGAPHVQQVVIDPEGEFANLADALGHLHVDAARLGSSALNTLAGRVREHRLSVVLDLSELSRAQQLKAHAAFVYGLVEVPREHWFPALVVIDEAQLFAPFGGQSTADIATRKAAIGATVDLMSLGRKRGLAGVLATLRLARLAKSVSSEVQNFLIGLNTQDLDVRRASELIGWDARKGFDRLPLLTPGQFVAVGPAFSQSPGQLTVGSVTTKHLGAAPPLLSAPRAVGRERAGELAGIEALATASEQEREEFDHGGFKAVRAFIREPAFGTAARIYSALLPLFPDGAALADLAKHLAVSTDEIAAGVALLDSYATVELQEGARRSVRLVRGMARP